jgi:hypothetical protein
VQFKQKLDPVNRAFCAAPRWLASDICAEHVARYRTGLIFC